MDLRVTEHRGLAAVSRLAGPWQELHDRAEDANPFSGPDWALTWLQHFASPQQQPRVLAVHENGHLVGVAPLLDRSALRGRAHSIQPIGVGQPWVLPYELSTMTALPSHGRAMARAVVQHLCGQPDQWDLTRLMLGQAAPYLEPEWLPSLDFAVLVRRTRSAVVLDLQSNTDIFTGRRNLKESFRRARNRLSRDFGADAWCVRRVSGASEVAAAFDRLAQLHRARADLREGQPVHADVVADPLVQDYLRDVVGRMAARGAVSVYELVVKDEVVASQLVLHTANASYNSFSGATPEAWPYSAVTYLQSRAVADAQGAGHRQVCLSTGPNQAKMRWTDAVQTTPEFWIVGPRRRSRALYLGQEMVGVLTSFREARQAHRV